MHRQRSKEYITPKVLSNSNIPQKYLWNPYRSSALLNLTTSLLPLTVTSLPFGTASNNGTPSNNDGPRQNDVVCARGKRYWEHPGNVAYRRLIAQAKNQYSHAKDRLAKSLIVSELIRRVHKTDGRFVKKQKSAKGEQSKWVECELHFVREKVTQSLRDGLSFKYSSSTTRKRQRKARIQRTIVEDIDELVHSNHDVSKKIHAFERQVDLMNESDSEGERAMTLSEEMILEVFVSANLDILETIKDDPSMSDRLQDLIASTITNTDNHVD